MPPIVIVHFLSFAKHRTMCLNCHCFNAPDCYTDIRQVLPTLEFRKDCDLDLYLVDKNPFIYNVLS